MNAALPDLFQFDHGEIVRDRASWRQRREELLRHLLAIEYGPLPAAAAVRAAVLNEHEVGRFDQARHLQYHLHAAGKQWVLDLLIPAADQPRPVILNGDGCWRYLTDPITQEVLRRGYILAAFNRTEVMPDTTASQCAIAAWAWAYQRCVDFLLTLPDVRASQIAVVGHSRGGKASLLAGATDERIALVGENGSGCCGSAPFRSASPGRETLAIITERFPHWFAPRLREFAGREGELPFDQHALLAAIAPRALISTLARGDLWANPTGTRAAHAAARPVWDLFQAAPNLALHERAGVHEHNETDWRAFLDFAEQTFHRSA